MQTENPEETEEIVRSFLAAHTVDDLTAPVT
jgi:hypothetical protein